MICYGCPKKEIQGTLSILPIAGTCEDEVVGRGGTIPTKGRPGAENLWVSTIDQTFDSLCFPKIGFA